MRVLYREIELTTYLFPLSYKRRGGRGGRKIDSSAEALQVKPSPILFPPVRKPTRTKLKQSRAEMAKS